MSDSDEIDATAPPQQPTEAEIRAALEEEMSHVHVGDVVLQTVVSLVNLAARRTGTAPETEGERDLEQVRISIDAVRALLPSVETVAPEQLPAVKDALSQLQLAYVKAGGDADSSVSGNQGAADGPGEDGETGPEDRPSRIWVPGS
ncbi:MAG: hypothetical protein F2799_00285 [Actinobacteria bacterium]|uniref:Unannotated protein n=1 Tax=freshwater metagenome TaxID=449393 RepID=A0A6J7CPJ8_9ZZZZ|nr:hypothetical protein [Actinomycetota bacterium]